MTPLELEDIARELREDRPLPSERFAAELDAWAAEGFPRSERSRRSAREAGSERARARRPATRRQRWLLPTFAAAATALIVIAVALSQVHFGSSGVTGGIGGGGAGGGSGTVQAGRPAGTKPAPAASERLKSSGFRPATGTVGTPPVPPSPGGLAAGRTRVQEQSASLTLSTDAGAVRDVADGVVDVTDRYGGFVVSSNVTSGDADRARATFDLKIPALHLQAALADLSDLAHVQSRNEGSLDITKAYVTAGGRYKDDRAKVESLLRQLASSTDPNETASLRAQLRFARRELAAARAQLRELKSRAAFSTVGVAVVSDGDGAGAWSIGDAADDALKVLQALGGAALVTLAVVVPLGAVLAAIWFAATGLRRRWRESVLD
jgi:hypothetical protein